MYSNLDYIILCIPIWIIYYNLNYIILIKQEKYEKLIK